MFRKPSVPVIGISFLLTGCGGAVTCGSLQADLEELTREIAGDFAAAQARAAKYGALLDQVLETGCARSRCSDEARACRLHDGRRAGDSLGDWPRIHGMELLTNEPDAVDGTAMTVALAHGAGAAMDSPFMNAVAEGLAARGLRVIRFEFPYMQKRRADGRRRGPDPLPVLQAAWREAIDKIGPAQLVIGGKSMGGRIASMVADAARVRGVVCLGYPFHPPGKPAKTRTAHLQTLRTPTLILQGTRDPFGKPDEVERYSLSTAVRVEWIDDGDHSFKPTVRSGRTLEQNLDDAIAAIRAFAAAC